MKTFQAIDIDHSGSIDAEEICRAIKKSKIINKIKLCDRCSNNEITSEDQSTTYEDSKRHDCLLEFAKKLIEKVDYDNNQEISYTEYLASTLQKHHLSEENLMNLFKYLDVYH